ncbi:MAG: hypothetical protein ABW182_02995 [Sphingomonas sp.]
MAGFNILNIIGDDWNDSGALFGGIKMSVVDKGSFSTSRFLEFALNGAPIYRVLKSGETVISTASGTSLGGMALRGGAGEMALTSQIHPSTGAPADVLRYYWEGTPGQVAVIRGMGTNRLSIESSGAMVHIAQNSRYEFEGYGASRLSFIGYEAGSAIGKTIDFNNYGQTPTRANPVVSVSTSSADADPLHIGTHNGQTWTTTARFRANGQLNTPGVIALAPTGAPRGFAAQSSSESTARFFFGLDALDTAFIGAGPGVSSLDSFIFRAGTNMWSYGGTTAAFPAIKRAGTALQAKLATDSDFTQLQGKLTTHNVAATGTITPNRTLTLYDAAGVAYKVPCVAA